MWSADLRNWNPEIHPSQGSSEQCHPLPPSPSPSVTLFSPSFPKRLQEERQITLVRGLNSWLAEDFWSWRLHKAKPVGGYRAEAAHLHPVWCCYYALISSCFLFLFMSFCLFSFIFSILCFPFDSDHQTYDWMAGKICTSLQRWKEQHRDYGLYLSPM